MSERKQISYKDERVIKPFNPDLPSCIICDIDGTIALRTGRSPFDYMRCNTDVMDVRMKANLLLYQQMGVHIFFITGREEKCRELTEQWLVDNGIRLTQEKMSGISQLCDVIMRQPKDRRKDAIVKEEVYNNLIKDQYNVIAVFEDRKQVVDMYRGLGLLTLQVYDGDF